MNRHLRASLALSIGLLAATSPLAAQEEPEHDIVGSWQGTLDTQDGVTLREWAADGRQIEGEWRQGGATLPLVLEPAEERR